MVAIAEINSGVLAIKTSPLSCLIFSMIEGKLWDREIKKWLDGFRRNHNPDTQAILADQEKLEQVMRDCIQQHQGYITAGMFARASGLTLYSARKQLKEWTKGDCPKLMMTPRGKEHIYTEI